jgi:hypothetical protein
MHKLWNFSPVQSWAICCSHPLWWCSRRHWRKHAFHGVWFSEYHAAHERDIGIGILICNKSFNFVKIFNIFEYKLKSPKFFERLDFVGREKLSQSDKFNGIAYRVDWVQRFYSSRRNWDSSSPSPAGECVPHLWFRGWDTLACGRGGGGQFRWRDRHCCTLGNEGICVLWGLHQWDIVRAKVVQYCSAYAPREKLGARNARTSLHSTV